MSDQQEQNATPEPIKKKGKAKWVVGGVIVLALGGLIFGGNDDTPAATPPPQAGAVVEPAPVEPAAVAPTQVTAATMISDLEANALKAESTYLNTPVEVSGYVGTIDAQGDYFAVLSEPDAFELTGITADIKEEHLPQVMEFTQDAPVTVVGTVTDVGEAWGIRIAVDTIK